MSDNPNKLTRILLNDADPALKEQFLKMVGEQRDSHELQKKHRCWTFIPTPTEYEKMRPFTQPPDYDKCPKCKKGRIILEFYHGNIGESVHLVCRGVEGCDFKLYISDDE